MSLAENIRARRQELKLSQVYVADRLGVSRQAVSKWEAGRSEPTASNLVDLAELLETSVSELVRTPSAPAAEEKSTLILRTNLSLMAIILQAGMLNSCAQVTYTVVDGERVPDHGFMLFKLVLLLACSVWMAWNLRYEKDLVQRRKNSRIELVYCCVQAAVALCTYHFGLGLLGTLLLLAVLIFYVLHINPRYMNRPFGKKNAFQ